MSCMNETICKQGHHLLCHVLYECDFAHNITNFCVMSCMNETICTQGHQLLCHVLYECDNILTRSSISVSCPVWMWLYSHKVTTFCVMYCMNETICTQSHKRLCHVLYEWGYMQTGSPPSVSRHVRMRLYAHKVTTFCVTTCMNETICTQGYQLLCHDLYEWDCMQTASPPSVSWPVWMRLYVHKITTFCVMTCMNDCMQTASPPSVSWPVWMRLYVHKVTTFCVMTCMNETVCTQGHFCVLGYYQHVLWGCSIVCQCYITKVALVDTLTLANILSL